MSNVATIYALTDPDTGEVRYIGRTKDVWKRYGSHLVRVQGSAAKHGWFLGLQQRQQLPGLKIIETDVEPSQAHAREQWWIDYYLASGTALVNFAWSPTPRNDSISTVLLSEILERHGIHTIRKLCQETGMSRQRGWMLWHGKAGVGKATAKLLHDKLGIPLEELILVDPVLYTGARKPPAPKRPPKRGRKGKGGRS